MILLLDFTCARRESHSWDSLLRFQKFLNSASPEHVTICIPRAELFPAHDSSSTFSLGLRVFEKQLSGESHRLNLREFFVSTFKILLSTRRVIKKFSPNKLVWPNTEGPSLLVGIILSILERNRNFYFRFIGWPEFWTPFRFLLLKLLIKAARFRKNVFLSFETQALMNFLNGHGIVVPYPIHLPESLKNQESRRVLLMGSARKEKGFESMYQFATELAKALPEFELVLQESMNSWDGYKEILQNLRSLPNVSSPHLLIGMSLME